MRIDELPQLQRTSSRDCIHSLIITCWRRYRDAARLIGNAGPVAVGLEDWGYKTIDLSPLAPAYETLCRRYIDDCFSGQELLFGSLDDAPGAKWTKYFHHRIIPSLSVEDEFARNVLRATGCLQCHQRSKAIECLVHHISEMTLPKEHAEAR
jgi:hypothetical protein